MIMAKDKTIKTATLKKRFEKLHHAANYAEECAKAIVFHADRLSMDGQSASQTEAFQRMANAIGIWTGKFARIGTEIQKVESMYLDHLTNDNTECKLIEQVPLIGKYGYVTPDAVQIEAKFFEIGYYALLLTEKNLYTGILLCIRGYNSFCRVKRRIDRYDQLILSTHLGYDRINLFLYILFSVISSHCY